MKKTPAAAAAALADKRRFAHKNRASLRHKIVYAAKHPQRVGPYLWRSGRDALLAMKAGNHIDYYRAVMRSDTARDPEAAVGSKSHARWLARGRQQFDYLVGHGLRPEDRILEIGCGNLRAGHLLIDYLDGGHYYGIDISPDILFAAEDTLTAYGLQGKLPYLTPVRDLTFSFLPDAHFTVIHAHSVFSHSPIHVIEECFAHVGRILAPGGFFDFTFDRTEAEEHQVLREDFYYRTETLIELAARHGLQACLMEDWERLPGKQSKIRVRHAVTAGQESAGGDGEAGRGAAEAQVDVAEVGRGAADG